MRSSICMVLVCAAIGFCNFAVAPAYGLLQSNEQEQQKNELLQELDRMKAMQQELRTKEMELRKKYEALSSKASEKSKALKAEALHASRKSAQLANLKAKLDQMESQFGKDHKKFREVETQVEELQRLMKDTMALAAHAEVEKAASEASKSKAESKIRQLYVEVMPEAKNIAKDGTAWRNWAWQFENDMNKWAKQQEHHWQKWAEDFSDEIEDSFSHLEDSDVDVGEIVELLESLPLEKMIQEGLKENYQTVPLQEIEKIVTAALEESVQQLETELPHELKKVLGGIEVTIDKLQKGLDEKNEKLDKKSQSMMADMLGNMSGEIRLDIKESPQKFIEKLKEQKFYKKDGAKDKIDSIIEVRIPDLKKKGVGRLVTEAGKKSNEAIIEAIRLVDEVRSGQQDIESKDSEIEEMRQMIRELKKEVDQLKKQNRKKQ